jgi:hypothetical protein
MIAQFRPLAGTLYVFKEGCLENHDEYVFSATVVLDPDQHILHIYGVTSVVTFEMRKAIREFCIKEGIEFVRWERWRNGKMHSVQFKVN